MKINQIKNKIMINLKGDPKIVIEKLKSVHIYDRTSEEKNEIIEFLSKIDIYFQKEYLYHVLDKDFKLYSNWYEEKYSESEEINENKITYDFMDNVKFKHIFDIIEIELKIGFDNYKKPTN